jgi:hypothetical protein
VSRTRVRCRGSTPSGDVATRPSRCLNVHRWSSQRAARPAVSTWAVAASSSLGPCVVTVRYSPTWKALSSRAFTRRCRSSTAGRAPLIAGSVAPGFSSWAARRWTSWRWRNETIHAAGRRSTCKLTDMLRPGGTTLSSQPGSRSPPGKRWTYQVRCRPARSHHHPGASSPSRLGMSRSGAAWCTSGAPNTRRARAIASAARGGVTMDTRRRCAVGADRRERANSRSRRRRAAGFGGISSGSASGSHPGAWPRPA